jgi:thiol-disulfide isomerase/thioredoxin
LLLAYLVWRPRYTKDDGTNHPLAGRALAPVLLEPLTGDVNRIQVDDLSGRVTLINFWGTWCPPCAEEFPYLAAINDRFKQDKSFFYVSVSCLGGDEVEHLAELQEATAEFLVHQRVKHATYYDPAAITRSALASGSGFPYPMTLVTDRRGVIRGAWEGFDKQSTVDIERLIETLLR